MNTFQRKLRVLIAAGSAIGFLGGWGLLAHAGKPVAGGLTNPAPAASTSVAPIQLPPLNFQSLESSSGSSNVQALPALPPMPSFSRPRLRSGGS
jgi:hypothetical protein